MLQEMFKPFEPIFYVLRILSRAFDKLPLSWQWALDPDWMWRRIEMDATAAEDVAKWVQWVWA